MRSQALLQRSRSLLKGKGPRASFSRSLFPSTVPSGKTPTPRPTTYGKRLASSTSPVTASEPPPLESPSDGPDAPLSFATPPESPAEEPEKAKRKKPSAPPKEPPKEPEPPLEFPQGLALEILWRPESDSAPSNQSALPPPAIFEEALHNLHITLHPQTQHRAAFASPLGPMLEPTLALYCPIEGGEYIIDATVRELARRTNAEVLVLDTVQLAAGEWGTFGKAANSLQLPRNPLHFRSAPPPNSRPFAPDEDEDEMDGSSSFSPASMTLTLLNPQRREAILGPTARGKGPPSKIEGFFETVVNASPDEQSPAKPRPRLVYIRDFPTLAPSSSAWYPPLLRSVRSRRRMRGTTTISHPMTIIFGITPSLVPKPSTGPRAPPVRRMVSQSSQRVISKQHETEWSEDEASERAREKRLRDRLRRWEKGDGLHDQFPKLSQTEEGSGESGLGFIIIGGSNAMMAQPNGSGDRDNNTDLESFFFRTSVLVPTARSMVEERACRVTRRREINELTMRMGVGAVGGVVDKEAASTVVSGTSQQGENDVSPPAELLPKKNSQHSMWEDWGNRIEFWSTVRAVADRAVGSAVAARAAESAPSKRTLEATPVDWPAIDGAWAAHRAGRDMRKAWMKEATSASSASKSVREQDEDEDDSDSEPESEDVDAVVERLKEEDLDDHEQRLLSCIVNPAAMPTSFSQVHLPAHTIDSIRTIVSLPLLHPQAFQQGILKEHSMTGCLLFGPPGTGKTLVVRALAKEAGCRMMVISPSDVMDMYVGEGEKLVKAVFSLARRIAPCVVFLDEIDALFGARVSGRDRGAGIAHRGVLTEFMQEMDGLRSSTDDSVIVIGATNRPFDLDDAVLRRLPRRLLVDLPGEPEREAILRILLRDETLGPDLDPKGIAQKTESFSGSDLKHLCVSAALDAVKEHVVVPWSSTSKPPVQESSDGEAVSDATAPQSAEPADHPIATSIPPDGETSFSDADEVPPPAVAPRILYLRHFTKALKEITPSSSAASGSLADLKKWNEEFGEGRSKKRQQVWGQGRFGFTEKKSNTSDDVRVVPAEHGQG
ncbi:hypothetical protein C8F04DRAFT_207153 [Mycena alexandri]|uniref:AAA+ ATPase domain-containing protein n=1 Tax=Mycena alexandri TaxID=1745969 RepID=A0AAD6TKQ2_9AGAR|nr:hypothetical protein C8F04DRAFT_207153 [Mycena alexandri]